MKISPVRIDTKRIVQDDGHVAIIEEWRGKSTDTKPERPPDRHGSTLYEMDTKRLFMYDGETLTWLLQ